MIDSAAALLSSTTGSVWLAAALLSMFSALSLRAIMRSYKAQSEAIIQPETGTKKRGSDSLDDPIRVMRQCADNFEIYYDRLTKLHRSTLNASRSIAMVGLVLILTGVLFQSSPATDAARFAMMTGGLIAECLALLLGLQTMGLGAQCKTLLEKVVSTQYLLVTVANGKDLEGEERSLERNRVNGHLRSLMDLLHASHKKRTLWDVLGEWQLKKQPVEDPYDTL